ncbi:hypothetical protein BDR05DRAFT_879888 [Suillus weaverae]|nr:hypothetical protein BDR05DRAFT_879888 [Suillus weaverae]
MEYKTLKNCYADEIATTKKQHWIDWLDDIEGNDLWTVNHYISSKPTNGGKSFILSLTIKKPDGYVIKATTNTKKSILIAEAFFPPPPIIDSVPADFIYLDLMASHTPITTDQIACTISKLSSFKALGPDSICNIIFTQCATLLTPYLVYIFNAVFTYKTYSYYAPWKNFTTVELQKPSKPTYTTPKAFCPITLLDTTCKLLTAIVTDQLTFLLEHHHLLPNIHFGGCPR